MEEGKPGGRVASYLANDFIDLGCGFCAARQDRQRVIETAQIKFDHHAVVALLDQKLVAFRREFFAHEFEFGF